MQILPEEAPKRKRGRPSKARSSENHIEITEIPTKGNDIPPPVEPELPLDEEETMPSKKMKKAENEIEEIFRKRAQENYSEKMKVMRNKLAILEQTIANLPTRFPVMSEVRKTLVAQTPLIRKQVRDLITELDSYV